EATKIPVYKQTGSVGCGAVALENLRRALYDNQDDTDTEQYMEDLDIRNYHELLYPPLANLNLDSTGQFLRISHRNTEWIKTDYWDNIGPTITDGVQKILRSVCNTQKHLDTNLQNSYNAKLPRGCSDDNNDVLEVLRISAKEFQASKVDTKKASNTQLPSKVNSKITDISGIIKAADLVDPVVCALNDDAILRDLLLEQPGLSFLSDLTPTEKQELLSEMQSTEAAPNISKKEPLASKTATKETNTLDCDTQITLIEIGEWLINNNQQYTAMSELDETYHWRDLPGCVTGSHPLATQLLGNNFEAQDFLLQYLTDGQTY
ncbi:MAG: hypothetical protein EB127_12075, partial [Alphaproteobacteria bacterium]|nr:hypothetical protein [Alphaproteobacteria bacterium]